MMPKTAKKPRSEVYADRNVQALLKLFLGDGISELEPVFDRKLGYRYPVVEKIIEGEDEVKSFLNKLTEVGLLRRRLYGKIIRCPSCDSANIAIHYCCPHCKSINIQKSALIEHVKCGYMDIEQNFQKGDRLVCPKCDGELTKVDVDYRRAGIWCTCGECKKSFDIPDTEHFCRDCEVSSTFEDALIEDVYAYGLEEEVKEEASKGWFLIAPIKAFLEANGFRVESPAFLEGKSGANHMFDIAAYPKGKQEDVMVIDFSASSEGPVQEQPVIALFAKMFDVSPGDAYLVAIPRMGENGKKMAELYNIKIIEAKDHNEAAATLEDILLEKA